MDPAVFGESNISRLHRFWNKRLRSPMSAVLLPSSSGPSTHSLSFPFTGVAPLSRDQRGEARRTSAYFLVSLMLRGGAQT